MSIGAWMMLIAIALAVSALGFVVFATVRSIVNERSRERGVWREFGLGLSLMLLFFGTWLAQGISEWQAYTDQQREHQQPTEAGDFIAHFAQSTLENWQSEFLQLFAFVSLAALYIHKGSAESKDSEEKMEASLRRIEKKLGTLPDDAPEEEGQWWKLPETPLQADDQARRPSRRREHADARARTKSGKEGKDKAGLRSAARA
jgi:hypothetical protein